MTSRGEFRSLASMRTVLMLLLLVMTCFVNRLSKAEERISLAGKWAFQLDHAGEGMSQNWFKSKLRDEIRLPGSLQNQGFGLGVDTETDWTGVPRVEAWLKEPQYAKYREPGHVKVPFCLQPERHYVGAAWYQREIEIPRSWRGKRVVLRLERPHWETRVWLDDQQIGAQNSLSAPHVYELGTDLKPGKHRLTIRVDNQMIVDVGSWAHSVTDNTQGNWNGIVGRIELEATNPVWIEDVQVYPDLARKSAQLKVRIGNATGRPGPGVLTIGAQKWAVNWDDQGGAVEIDVPQDKKAQTWDEFHPALTAVTMQLKEAGPHPADIDRRTITFGWREIGVRGKEFVLNGRPVFFRGALECCVFPLTGYPPTEVEPWKRLMETCRAYGLNHVRFHSYCPPEAAFEAADELGIYLSVEVAAWPKLGDGKPIDKWLYEEAGRILKAYGNHPSFVLMPCGNEPSGANQAGWLGEWVNHWKQTDPRRLYTSASGWPAIPENQYHVSSAPRGPKGWLGKDYRFAIESGRDRRDTVSTIDVPVIVHEMGQWCSYPNLNDVSKYSGPLKAKNFEIFRDSLAAHGLSSGLPDFVRASGELQVACYKEEIEAALRTPGLGGFQLLGLTDFPGQGTAPVGVLDAFWDSKGYIKPEQFRQFCGPVVPVVRLFKRVWRTDETLSADVEVANFGQGGLSNVVAQCILVDGDGNPVQRGELPAKTIPIGQGTLLGRAMINLSVVAAPKAYKLVVRLKGTEIENSWNVWVYPVSKPLREPADIFVVSNLDERVFSLLKVGHRVLWLPTTLPERHPVLTFEPIFWNRYMFNSQPSQTLGLLCDAKNPALAKFPTESCADWQWEQVVSGARAMVLDQLPKTLRPTVQPIDDWNTNRRLGLIFECRVGRGKLLACSADLVNDLENRPAAQRLRQSLLSYMASGDFEPSVQVKPVELMGLVEEEPATK
jgi:beta-galactosidase